MKGHCEQMQDQMTDHVLDLLDSHQQDTLLKHIKTCAACETALRKTEEKHNLLSAIGRQFGTDIPDRIDRCISALNQTETEPRAKWTIQWRHIMARPIAKIAVAAVIIIAAILAVSFLDKSVTTAYAIEQTIEANRSLRFIHLKDEPAGTGGTGVEDMWAEFNSHGKLMRLRMNFPNSADGPKDVIWQEGRAEVWFKAKKCIAVVKAKNILAQLKMSYQDFDPKSMGEQLSQVQAEDAKQITIQESQAQGEPITITRTRNGFRTVYKVDPDTKLLLQYENYQIKDGEYEFIGRTKYLDYNESVDPGVFEFDPPAGVVLVDQTAPEVTMSNEESAVKLVRQFVEAAIAQDYTKASKLIANIPAGWVEEQPYQQEQVVRLISVGKPELNAETGSLSVPCQVEVEKDGQTSVQSIVFRVQQVYGQPKRWKIIDFNEKGHQAIILTHYIEQGRTIMSGLVWGKLGTDPNGTSISLKLV